MNDGTGHYPARIELRHPAFNDGYTAVNALTRFDVDADGFPDLLLVHHRNDDGPSDMIPWTGRYVQVLINLGTPSRVLRRRRSMSFVDQTPTRMGDQIPTVPQRNAEGERLVNYAAPKMHDVGRDGCAESGDVREPGRSGHGRAAGVPQQTAGASSRRCLPSRSAGRTTPMWVSMPCPPT